MTPAIGPWLNPAWQRADGEEVVHRGNNASTTALYMVLVFGVFEKGQPNTTQCSRGEFAFIPSPWAGRGRKKGSFHVSPKVVNSLLGSIALLVNCRRSSLVRESFPQSDSSQDEAI